MIALLIGAAVAIAFYVGYDWATFRDEIREADDPPFSISELVDLSGELRNLGPFDQEAWR